MTIVNKTEKLISHPLEEVFDIESGTTAITSYEAENLPSMLFEPYDDKDVEIEDQFQEVYEKAMTAFTSQMDDCAIVDPKYTARKSEVAAVFLNTALAAAKEKASLKQTKEKLIIASIASKKIVTNNNLVVTSRNDLLKLLAGNSKSTTAEVLPPIDDVDI